LVEPMGVEPTTSKVRFQIMGRQQTFVNKTLQAFQYIRPTMFGFVRHTSALVLGQKADNPGWIFSQRKADAPSIAHLICLSNLMLHKDFSTAVRELSVSFKQGDGNDLPIEDVSSAIRSRACGVSNVFAV
jgi:hypothetical protein